MPRTVPVMPTESPGLYNTGALFNATMKALGDFTTNKPYFSGYAVASQSIPASAFTPMSIDTEVFDFDQGHSTVTNISRYTCQVAGVYELTGTVVFPTGGTGVRGAMFALNGATTTGIVGSEQIVSPSPTFATTVSPTPTQVRLAVGDYVQLCGYQNTAGALSTTTIGAAFTTFNVEWIGA